jgi:hypothetical protein
MVLSTFGCARRGTVVLSPSNIEFCLQQSIRDLILTLVALHHAIADDLSALHRVEFTRVSRLWQAPTP